MSINRATRNLVRTRASFLCEYCHSAEENSNMSSKELQAYVLAHRDDNQAFYAYVDKLHAEKKWVKHPPLKSIDDMENYPEFLEKLRQYPGRRG
jgi:predicted Rossmann fold nucleotide-binding protein DprA/Smf involved in DNA uptake